MVGPRSASHGSYPAPLELGIHKSYQQVVDKYGDIPVRVYSNAGSVELFLNGKSQGRKTFQEKWTSDGRKYQEGEGSDQLYLEWRLAYQPGELRAVAYDRQGQIVEKIGW